MTSETTEKYKATKNACKLCAPLGASLVFKGVAGAIALLHGSQGCATYIRRYLISHFKEPIDIACSNFAEETAIFGGGSNLKMSIDNLRQQYGPALVGIATTCLSETIGDDVGMYLHEYAAERNGEVMPPMVHVSTPSYQGTHMEGFHATVLALVRNLVRPPSVRTTAVNVFPGMLSPADLRYLKEILDDFGLTYTLLPDYSETLDGAPWREYEPIPAGGTPIESIRAMGAAAASFSFGRILAARGRHAGAYLSENCNVPCFDLGMPVGMEETDRFLKALSIATGKNIPEKYQKERGRLLDSYIDGHKYVSGKRVVVFGEEDLVVGICAFLKEIGAQPILAASGGGSGHLARQLEDFFPNHKKNGPGIMADADFVDIEAAVAGLAPDALIGNSKGYAMARRLRVPLLRVGFPIHDRMGGPRHLHIGYRGAQNLFDRLANAMIEQRQSASDVGYAYM